MKKYFLNILSLVFLVVTLTTLTAITANPEIKQLISSQAKRERDDPNAGEDGKKGQKDIESDPDARIRKAERVALSEGGNQYSINDEQCVGFSCLQIQEGQIASDKLSKETAGIIEPGQAIDAQIVSDAFNQLAQQQASTPTEATKIQAAPIAQVTPQPLIANTNASCGVGMIAEDEICRNSTTGAITEYKDIVLYNAAIGNFTSSLTREEKEYVINLCNSRNLSNLNCGSVDSPITDNVLNFSILELNNSDTKDLFERANDVNEAKDATGSLADINATTGTISIEDLITPKKINGSQCEFSSDCDSGYCTSLSSYGYKSCQVLPEIGEQDRSTATLDPSSIDAKVGSLSNIDAAYNFLNDKTYGAFGVYVQTYQDINNENPEVSNNMNPFTNPEYYTKKVFNKEGLGASALLASTVLTNGTSLSLIEGRDVIIENAKYSFYLGPGTPNTFYLIGPDANKQVYEKGGVIYDAKTNLQIGTKDEFAGYSFVKAPKIVYSGGGSDFTFGGQHTTITQQTFNDPELQKIIDQVQSKLARNPTAKNPITISEMGQINTLVNKGIEYYQPKLWTGYDSESKPLLGVQQSTDLQGDLIYHTLDNLIRNDATVCFDKAIAEQLVLASYGIKSELIGNNKLGHAYLIVHDGPATFVLDPTKGGVQTLYEHMQDNAYLQSDTYTIPSAVDTLP